MVKFLATKTKTIALNLKSSILPLSQIKLCKAGMIREFGSYHIVETKSCYLEHSQLVYAN